MNERQSLREFILENIEPVELLETFQDFGTYQKRGLYQDRGDVAEPGSGAKGQGTETMAPWKDDFRKRKSPPAEKRGQEFKVVGSYERGRG